MALPTIFPDDDGQPKYNSPTNPSLIHRFIHHRKDSEIENLFINKYQPIIKNYIIYLVQENDNIDELVQEVFLKILKNLKSFKHGGPGSFRAWLKKVVNSAYCDWVSVKKKQNQVLRIGLLDPADPGEELSELFAKEYDREIMKGAISRVRLDIDPRTWEMFERTKILDEDPEKVAASLGVMVRTVYSAGYRVLKKIKELCQKIDSMGIG